MNNTYPRITSFDSLKQSTCICAYLITLSTRTYIILNQLFCFQSKHTFWEVRERMSLLFKIKISLSTSVSVLPLFILTDTSVYAFHWLLAQLQKTIVFTVVKCSQGVLCNVQGRPKIISNLQLKINMANAVCGHLILKWF